MLKNVVRWNLYGNIIFNRHATIVCDLNIHQRLFSQRFRRDKQTSQTDRVSECFWEEDESILSPALFISSFIGINMGNGHFSILVGWNYLTRLVLKTLLSDQFLRKNLPLFYLCFLISMWFLKNGKKEVKDAK